MTIHISVGYRQTIECKCKCKCRCKCMCKYKCKCKCRCKCRCKAKLWNGNQSQSRVDTYELRSRISFNSCIHLGTSRAFAWLQPKFLKKYWSPSSEHMVVVRKCSWVQITSHQSYPLTTLTPRLESNQSRHPNVVIKSLCVTLDICRDYHTNAYFQRWFFCYRPRLKDAFLKSCLSVAFLYSLADFVTEIHFGREIC